MKAGVLGLKMKQTFLNRSSFAQERFLSKRFSVCFGATKRYLQGTLSIRLCLVNSLSLRIQLDSRS